MLTLSFYCYPLLADQVLGPVSGFAVRQLEVQHCSEQRSCPAAVCRVRWLYQPSYGKPTVRRQQRSTEAARLCRSVLWLVSARAGASSAFAETAAPPLPLSSFALSSIVKLIPADACAARELLRP